MDRIPEDRRVGGYVVDTYDNVARVPGHRNWIRKRHRACGCPVPCQRTFKCKAPGHVGSRWTPWCNGAADEWPEWCDACAVKAIAREEAAGRAALEKEEGET